VVGNYIGRSLLAALRDAGYERNITLLNDTIATLLAGRAAGEAGRYGGYVGFILGTGTNTAYVESNRNITKRADLDPAGCQAVNVESGNFGRCPRTDIDEAFDLATSNPGRYVFEKMISGAYLGGLCLQTLRSAADDGVFTADGKSRVLSLAALSTKEADDFLGDPLREGPLRMPGLGGEDREAVATLLSAVFGRAALLTAVNLGAAIVKSGAGRDAARPACATVDGSTFYKTRGFKALVEEHLGRLLRPRGLHAELVRVENAPIIGAAVAGLTCQPATQAAATGPAPSARPRPAPGPAACSTDPWRPAPSTCG
jgi:hexokinase